MESYVRKKWLIIPIIIPTGIKSYIFYTNYDLNQYKK